jgi:hypothetical protein
MSGIVCNYLLLSLHSASAHGQLTPELSFTDFGIENVFKHFTSASIQTDLVIHIKLLSSEKKKHNMKSLWQLQTFNR